MRNVSCIDPNLAWQKNHVKNHLDDAYTESGYGSLRYSWKLRNAEIRCLAGSHKRVSLVFPFDSSASACVSNSSQGGSSLTSLLAFLLSRVMWKHTIIITTISKPSGRKPATAKAVEKNWTRKLSASITTAIRATMTKCLLLLFEFANRFWFSFSWDGNDWKPVGNNGKKILGLAPVDQRKILKFWKICYLEDICAVRQLFHTYWRTITNLA